VSTLSSHLSKLTSATINNINAIDAKVISATASIFLLQQVVQFVLYVVYSVFVFALLQAAGHSVSFAYLFGFGMLHTSVSFYKGFFCANHLIQTVIGVISGTTIYDFSHEIASKEMS
jgi:hypothetical protein